MTKAEALGIIATRRTELMEELKSRLAEGKIGSGELSPLVRELDFLQALKEVVTVV